MWQPLFELSRIDQLMYHISTHVKSLFYLIVQVCEHQFKHHRWRSNCNCLEIYFQRKCLISDSSLFQLNSSGLPDMLKLCFI